METGFEHEAYERAKVYKELVRMDHEVAFMKQSGSCAVSNASTEHGLGSGTFTRPPPLGRNWKENWMPGKMEVTDWVKNCVNMKVEQFLCLSRTATMKGIEHYQLGKVRSS